MKVDRKNKGHGDASGSWLGSAAPARRAAGVACRMARVGVATWAVWARRGAGEWRAGPWQGARGVPVVTRSRWVVHGQGAAEARRGTYEGREHAARGPHALHHGVDRHRSAAGRTPAAVHVEHLLHGVPWSGYEALLAWRGEASRPRISYLHGELELMSPSRSHERIKKTLARLVETFADVRSLPLTGFGSWTIKEAAVERGAEPDECYNLGLREGEDPERPDLAIEVASSRGGIDKLEIYRLLGVGEVWMWEEGRIRVFPLRGDRYEEAQASLLLPDLDLVRAAELAAANDQPGAVRTWRRELGA